MNFFFPSPKPREAQTVSAAGDCPSGDPPPPLISQIPAFLHRLSSSPVFSLLHSTFRFAARPPQAIAATTDPRRLFDLAMKVEDLEERLAGVPVYALSNSDEEFMLVSGVKSRTSLGLLCFKREDADALLDKVQRSKPEGLGSKVVSVALNKVFQLKVNGVAFRFIPDSHQVANAIKLMEQSGGSSEGFNGVPVFQSQSLVLRYKNEQYRPVFFRKEDLEDSLFKTSKRQNVLSPSFRKGNIQVAALEEIISEMKGSSASKWDDVVFIPPGFDIAGRALLQQKSIANA